MYVKQSGMSLNSSLTSDNKFSCEVIILSTSHHIARADVPKGYTHQTDDKCLLMSA